MSYYSKFPMPTGGSETKLRLIDVYNNTTNQSSYTWSSVNLGTTTGHIILALFSATGNPGMTTWPTCNGVSMPPLSEVNVANLSAGIYLTPTPISGIGTFVTTFAANRANFKAFLFHVQNYKGLEAQSTYGLVSSGNVASNTVNATPNGVILSIVGHQNAVGDPGFTWTNAVDATSQLVGENRAAAGITRLKSGSQNIQATWYAAGNQPLTMCTASLK